MKYTEAAHSQNNQIGRLGHYCNTWVAFPWLYNISYSIFLHLRRSDRIRLEGGRFSKMPGLCGGKIQLAFSISPNWLLRVIEIQWVCALVNLIQLNALYITKNSLFPGRIIFNRSPQIVTDYFCGLGSPSNRTANN
jgi:hypothetical protein